MTAVSRLRRAAPGRGTPGSRVPERLHPARIRTLWRSPIRGPWLTSVFGAVLLVGIPVEFITGLMSWAAYDPRLAGNDQNPVHGFLSVYLFSWFTRPSWIYRVTQGVHVLFGLVLVPVILAKLWSVIPRLFEWPPLRSVAQALERISLLLVVGGAVFEFATGILNIGYDYVFRFSFYDGHFFGAWLFITGFVIHAVLKFPAMRAALRQRRLRDELRTGLADTRPEEPGPDGTHGPDDTGGSLVPVDPAPATISRRGALALVGGGSLSVFLLTAGQSIGALRPISLLSARTQSYGSGPNAFQVNRTARAAGIRRGDVDGGWQLQVSREGGPEVTLTRAQLLAMEQTTADLPIACVEGWSTQQRWTGVPLRRLAAMVGLEHPTGAVVHSLERHGAFNRVALSGAQARTAHTLLALRVNGADLSLDHGFPARLIIPAAPGVHNTKWVERIVFTGER